MGPNPNKSNGHHTGQWNSISGGGDKLSPACATTDDGADPVSSYAGIWKFPSFKRENFLPNSFDYMKGRRHDEGIGQGRWRVHNKLYDLRSFASQHPGGEDWITITEGTDITEAFEVSHVMNPETVRRVLAKYFVGDALTPRNSPFTFKENGFYKTLQRRVQPVLRAEGGPGSRRSMLFVQDGLALAYVVLAVVAAYADSFLLHLLTGLVLGWVSAGGHNFLHLKDNWRKYYMDISLLSSHEWRMGHALSHHLFANTVLDYEVTLFEPWTEFGVGKPRNWAQRYLSHLYIYLLFGLYHVGELAKRVGNIFIRWTQPLRPENLLPLAFFLFNLYFTQSILDTIRISFVQHFVASMWISMVGSASAAHHHPESFHEGDITRRETDFGLCQLDIVKHSTEEYHHNAFVACLSFGEHGLHHLFPTVCHSKLPALQPTFQAVLKEFGEQLQAANTYEKFAGIHGTINRNTFNDFNKKTNN